MILQYDDVLFHAYEEAAGFDESDLRSVAHGRDLWAGVDDAAQYFGT